jgi:hypothetical protein
MIGGCFSILFYVSKNCNSLANSIEKFCPIEQPSLWQFFYTNSLDIFVLVRPATNKSYGKKISALFILLSLKSLMEVFDCQSDGVRGTAPGIPQASKIFAAKRFLSLNYKLRYLHIFSFVFCKKIFVINNKGKCNRNPRRLVRQSFNNCL